MTFRFRQPRGSKPVLVRCLDIRAGPDERHRRLRMTLLSRLVQRRQAALTPCVDIRAGSDERHRRLRMTSVSRQVQGC